MREGSVDFSMNREYIVFDPVMLSRVGFLFIAVFPSSFQYSAIAQW